MVGDRASVAGMAVMLEAVMLDRWLTVEDISQMLVIHRETVRR